MSYVGNTPTTQSFIAGTDYFNGTGSATAFTLSRSVVSVNDIQAVVNNVVQVPNDAYTVSGTTITFTSAPSSGTSNIYVRYLSTTTQSITPSQNTVSYSTLNSDNQSKLGISFKNRIINGAMVIDQRNAGASYAQINGGYSLDRWSGNSYTSGATTGKYTVQQNAGSVTPPAGFTNYLGVTSSAATSSNAGDIYNILQKVEGFNIGDLGWGTANAKTITLSFWVRSSATGTFGGIMQNVNVDYGYPFTYSISSANTWEQKTVTIAGPTSGTWNTTNGNGIQMFFNLQVGSSFTASPNSWQSTGAYGASGCVQLLNNSGATWYITGVQLEVGTQATTFDYRSYGTELALCQRYFESSVDIGEAVTSGTINTFRTALGTYSSNQYFGPVVFKINKRAQPTITFYNESNTTGALTAYNASTAVSTSASAQNIGTACCAGQLPSVSGYTFVQGKWSASAEL